MTKEEILASVSLRDVMERYGVHINQAGFACCPFHDEKTPSLKVYKDNHFYCFGCHAHGDIFDFVMKMEQCSFAEAFAKLGGDKFHASSELTEEMQMRKAKKQKFMDYYSEKKSEYSKICSDLHLFRRGMEMLEPFSDNWCACVRRIPKLEGEADWLLVILDAAGDNMRNGSYDIPDEKYLWEMLCLDSVTNKRGGKRTSMTHEEKDPTVIRTEYQQRRSRLQKSGHRETSAIDIM